MNTLFRNSVVRLASEQDIPHILELGKLRYDLSRQQRAEQSISWLKWAINNPNSIALVGPNTAGVASVALKYGFEKKARLDMLVAKLGNRAVIEALQMVKAMVRWAAINGAEGTFRIDADTGVDFGPFAKRLGGVEVDPVKYPRYDIPLDGGAL